LQEQPSLGVLPLPLGDEIAVAAAVAAAAVLTVTTVPFK